MTRGSVVIVVTNADQCENGWELSIDDGTASHHSGKTVPVARLRPGQHFIHIMEVTGHQAKKKAKKKTKQWTGEFSVEAGRVKTLEYTLI